MTPPCPPNDESARPSSALDPKVLSRLLDVTRRINSETDPDAILGTIVDSLVSIAGADRGFLMLRGEDGALRFAVARDRKGQPLEERKFQVSRGVVDEVAQSGEARLIDDAASSDAYNARMSIVSLSLRTILCVPLTTQAGVIGVIYVDSNAITRRFTADDLPLVESFAAQAATTLERVRLERAARERDRMAAQLQIAAEIQRTFLPARFPPAAGVVGAVAAVPAQQVGGDLYDVLRFPDGRVGVIVGDVAGKGVPGALFGARLLSDLRAQALLHGDLGATVTALNAIVAERATRGMFVTLIYVVVDPSTGICRYANAGHLAPTVRRANGSLERWEGVLGPPLGILPTISYETGEGRLERGEVLVLLTDGLGDAVGANDERFEDERVADVISRAEGGPQDVVDRLLAATAAFTGERPQADDQTLLAIALA